MGGRLKDADPETFVVCDDGVEGIYHAGHAQIPYGYGKDKTRVYYYDYNGKPNWVRKAIAESFVSLNDGHFGRDEKTVFCDTYIIPKAHPATWRKLERNRSRGFSVAPKCLSG